MDDTLTHWLHMLKDRTVALAEGTLRDPAQATVEALDLLDMIDARSVPEGLPHSLVYGDGVPDVETRQA